MLIYVSKGELAAAGIETAFLVPGAKAVKGLRVVVAKSTVKIAGKSINILEKIGKSSTAKINPWLLDKFARGNYIERKLGGMCTNFPVIDKFVKNSKGVVESITSIKSLDFNARTYSKGNRIYNKLMKDAEKLNGFTKRTWAKDTVETNKNTKKILEVAMPENPSEFQLNQIRKVVKDAKDKYGISVSTHYVNNY
ncbi:MAG: hypothetical protein PHF46_01850 [Candidatus Gracilibacteria bacterium]|nr:hypothetical protein [Candidatus Gracilibacteria bacterium]